MRLRSKDGFSLVELLVVVAIFAIIAAVSVPFIINWISGFQLRAGMSEVSSELQTARIQAIMKNARRGVALYVVDSNSYRFVNLDLANSPTPAVQAQALGVVRTLPPNILFDAAATALPGAATAGVRFSRLGGACAINPATCDDAPGPICVPADDPGCADNFTTDFQMRGDGAGDTRVGLRDQRSGLTGVLTISLGGRTQ